MSMMPLRVALLDTSVLIDHFKSRSRRRRIESAKTDFEWTLTTDIALLEFKAVLVQQMITIHGALRHYKKLTVARDVLCETIHPQVKLRFHIFNNLICVFGGSFDVTEDEDLRLGERARLLLEPLIPKVYRDVQNLVGSVQRRIKCTRAEEPPRKRTVSFAPNIPLCIRGKNKNCVVESFIRERVLPNLDNLKTIAANLGEQSQQFDRACQVFERVANENAELSHSDCRRAGDCLIAFGAEGLATHVLSTNRREWEPLSGQIGATYHHVEYVEETRD